MSRAVGEELWCAARLYADEAGKFYTQEDEGRLVDRCAGGERD